MHPFRISAPVQKTGRSASRSVAVVAGVCVVLGLVTRVALYLRNGPLTLDETMLALNVAMRGLYGLTRPLAFEQTAPLLFLWASRCAVRLAGVTEYALRATPFIAGLILPPAVGLAADELVSRRAACVAAALAMLCPIDVQYAVTFKQYAIDAAVAAVQLVLVLRVARQPDRRGAWLALLGACVLAPVTSAPSLFVTPVALAALTLAPTIRKRRSAYPRLAGLAVIWATVAGVNFFRFQRSTVTSAYMQRFWAGAFLQPPARAAANLIRIRIGFMIQEVLLGNSINYPAVWRILLLLVAVLGCWRMIRREGVWTGVLLIGPIAAVVVAAAARVYPLSDRTLLFLAPTCILAVVAGLEAGADLLGPSRGAMGFAVSALCVLIPPAADAVARLRSRVTPDLVRTTTAMVWRDVQRGEPVYVFSRDVPVWAFYTTDWSHPDLTRVRALLGLAASTGPNSGNARSRSGPVRDEGSGLVLHDSGRTEMIGVPTGMEDQYLGARSRTTDPGWSTNEAARIQAAAAPRAWLFFTYWNPRVDAWLVDILVASGGRIVARVVDPSIRVYQYEADLRATGRESSR
jgi:Dolichyl-phosphate-mannose-protein mannosyltransferase